MSDFQVSTSYDSGRRNVQLETPDLKRWNLSEQEARQLAQDLLSEAGDE
jgi:phage gp16-like protein